MKCYGVKLPAGFVGLAGCVLLLLAAVSPAQEIRKALPVDAAKTADDQSLDLDACFQLAAIRSDTLAISAQDIVAAQASYRQAIASLFPTVNFVNSQNFFNKTGAQIQDNRVVSGRSYSSYNAITGNVTLFDGFANTNRIGAAKEQVLADRYTLSRAYQTLYQNVALAFYNILQYERDLEILNDLQKAYQDQVKELERRVKIGRSRPADLLQGQANMATNNVAIEQMRGALAAARENMAFYIGKPANDFKLRDTLPFPTAGVIEAYLTKLGDRPDILSAVASMRSAERQLSVAKGARWPQVSLNGNYYLAQDPSSDQEYSFGFTISLPIFDGGLINAQIRQQQAVFTQSQLQVDELRREADQDLRSVFASFNSSLGQTFEAEEAARVSQLYYEAVKDDYTHGVAAYLDVITAQQTYFQNRRAYADADANARLNLIQLHVAAGTVKTGANDETVTKK
ncbi:MAG: TolC family protein [Verrucomicrobiales bacterium]|jgi:outer membrane protein|nr:TolC family protein [Verrucomicrobiales bacterium]